MELSFSEVERLILFNQYTILAEIARIQDNISDADVYEKKAIIISGGYQHEYDILFQDLGLQMDNEKCSDLWNILNMYACLQYSARQIGDTELMRKCLFPGFDGNYEIDQLRYCEFILQTLERFSGLELQNTDVNSHCEMSDRYHAQLERYKWGL